MKAKLFDLSVCTLMIGLVVSMAGGTATARQATILRVRQPSAGGDGFIRDDCPDEFAPPSGTVCHETYLMAYRETHVLDGGSNAPSQAPWAFFAMSYTVTFVDAEGDAVMSDVVTGFTDQGVVGSSDDQRVSSLTVTATVEMTDGSTFAFHGTWSGYGERWVYGSDGPFHGAEGLPRHYVDRCTTFNSNDHQTGRNATLVGMVNGQPFDSYEVLLPVANIFYNHFVYVTVEHGNCS